eukprot:GHVN01089764.1.p1 GENE.GHVN01089764.1~~GHVN01089764.1.p1  ORF type:complete len:939 (+),score=324.98 GHVN01089764.1:403-2817(+)
MSPYYYTHMDHHFANLGRGGGGAAIGGIGPSTPSRGRGGGGGQDLPPLLPTPPLILPGQIRQVTVVPNKGPPATTPDAGDGEVTREVEKGGDRKERGEGGQKKEGGTEKSHRKVEDGRKVTNDDSGPLSPSTVVKKEPGDGKDRLPIPSDSSVNRSSSASSSATSASPTGKQVEVESATSSASSPPSTVTVTTSGRADATTSPQSAMTTASTKSSPNRRASKRKPGAGGGGGGDDGAVAAAAAGGDQADASDVEERGRGGDREAGKENRSDDIKSRRVTKGSRRGGAVLDESKSEQERGGDVEVDIKNKDKERTVITLVDRSSESSCLLTQDQVDREREQRDRDGDKDRDRETERERDQGATIKGVKSDDGAPARRVIVSRSVSEVNKDVTMNEEMCEQINATSEVSATLKGLSADQGAETGVEVSGGGVPVDKGGDGGTEVEAEGEATERGEGVTEGGEGVTESGEMGIEGDGGDLLNEESDGQSTGDVVMDGGGEGEGELKEGVVKREESGGGEQENGVETQEIEAEGEGGEEVDGDGRGEGEEEQEKDRVIEYYVRTFDKLTSMRSIEGLDLIEGLENQKKAFDLRVAQLKECFDEKNFYSEDPTGSPLTLDQFIKGMMNPTEVIPPVPDSDDVALDQGDGGGGGDAPEPRLVLRPPQVNKRLVYSVDELRGYGIDFQAPCAVDASTGTSTALDTVATPTAIGKNSKASKVKEEGLTIAVYELRKGKITRALLFRDRVGMSSALHAGDMKTFTSSTNYIKVRTYLTRKGVSESTEAQFFNFGVASSDWKGAGGSDRDQGVE